VFAWGEKPVGLGGKEKGVSPQQGGHADPEIPTASLNTARRAAIQ